MDDTHCPILSLPPELRLCIYNHLFASYSPRPCTFTIQPTGRIQTFSLPAFKWEGAASILRTCKLINQEATPMLYEVAPFKISHCGYGLGYLPPSEDYGHIRDCPTLGHLRHLAITLHLSCGWHADDTSWHVEDTLQRVAIVLDALDARRALMSCNVKLVLHWDPDARDAEVALTVVRWILDLERRGTLTTVECQVYTQLWTEAMRVSSRSPFEYESVKKFRRYLKEVHVGEEHQVANVGRVYDLRPRKII